MIRSSALVLSLVAITALLTGCSDDSCFVEGTAIATPTGEVPIESLEVGDPVLAFDHATNQVTVSHVTRTWVHHNKPYQTLALPSGRTLGVTGNHPIYSGDRYQRAGDLSASSRLLQLENPATRSLSRASLPGGTDLGGFATVYNISVDGHENYFAAGILVHNKSPACSAEFPQFCTCEDDIQPPGCVQLDAAVPDSATPDAPAPDAPAADAGVDAM